MLLDFFNYRSEACMVLKLNNFVATVCIYTTSLSEGGACICKTTREAEFIYSHTANILLVNEN